MAELSQMRVALLTAVHFLSQNAFHLELVQCVCPLDSDSCPKNNRKAKSSKRRKCSSLVQNGFTSLSHA